VRVEIALENHGRKPVRFVEILDSFGAALAETKALLDPGPLPPGRRHRLVYRTLCTRLWGVYTVGPLALSVADPLGLFSARRLLGDLRPFDLFPRVHPVGGIDQLGARTSFSPTEATAGRAGASAVYLGVRDFRPGDEVMILPSGLTTTIEGIDLYGAQLEEAMPPQSVTMRLADNLDVSRGDMICRPNNAPTVTQEIDAMICWFNDRTKLTPGAKYAFLTGNSLAAAHTAGVVALLMERNPKLDVGQIATLLTDTTSYSAGNATINACRALERLTATSFCPRGPDLARF